MSKMNYEIYKDFKEKNTNKSYFERFSDTKNWFFRATFLGNAISISLAFFFFYDLISRAFTTGDDGSGRSYLTSIIIVIFLFIFEMIKRKVFDDFSLEMIKAKKTFFKKETFMFIVSTLLIISGSFYFSLNGAKEFMNKEDKIEETFKNDLAEKTDEINTYYNDEIDLLKSENVKNQERIDEIYKIKKKNRWLTKAEANQMETLTETITKNKEQINILRTKKEEEISKIKDENSSEILVDKEENQNNIFIFLILSAMIEIIILGGIYFKKYFEYRVITDYEETVMKSSKFKKWVKFNEILEIIFKNDDVKLNQPLISTKALNDIIEIEEIDISKKEVDECFKIMSFLQLSQTEGNKRILKKPKDECFSILKEHYNIL